MTQKLVVALALLFAASCTKRINECDSDADCTNPAYPFCDVDGQYAASGGQKNVCTIVPPNCPVSRCGCDPGAVTCGSDTLLTCNADGKSQTMATCSLGCEGDGTACKTFAPSNGLGAALGAADSGSDIVFPASVLIDTDTGVVVDSGNLPVAVSSLVVTSDGADIRVYAAHSFAITTAYVSGSKSIAFVAPGEIVLNGALFARASNDEGGPGASFAPASSDGVNGNGGGGGGGNGTAGGYGADGPGLVSAPGGAALLTFEPLVGGGYGGEGSAGFPSGAGGGAVELVSLTSIDVASGGVIDVGGGGGDDGAGGGAGGTVVLEAPTVTIDGTLAANGGGGGGCGASGSDATEDETPAAGVSCGTSPKISYSGAGGTVTSAAGNGHSTLAGTASFGGGGAVGRAAITTQSGTYAAGSGSIVSAAVTSAQLVAE